jgi:hypothetical protein
VIVNNSANISRTNNNLSPQIIERKQRTRMYTDEHPGPGLRQAQTRGGIKQVNDIPNLHFISIFASQFVIYLTNK